MAIFNQKNWGLFGSSSRLEKRLAEDALYESVLLELEGDNLDPVAMAKALEEAQGDQAVARSLYIKNRIRRVSDLKRAQIIRDANKEAKTKAQIEEAVQAEFKIWQSRWLSLDPQMRQKLNRKKRWSVFMSQRGVEPRQLFKKALASDDPQLLLDALISLDYNARAERSQYGLLKSYHVEKHSSGSAHAWHFPTGDDLMIWAKQEYENLSA